MRRLSLLALVLVSTISIAQNTYRWIDPATGKTMITDSPPPGSIRQVNKSTSNSSDEGQQPYALKRATDNFPVTLYTSTNCIDDCKNARDLLNKRGVPFTEKMVRTAEDIEALKAISGEVIAPTLSVGKQVAKGFLADSYNNLLDLAGYPTSASFGRKPLNGKTQ